MKLPIYIYGHPVLREVGQDITADYEGLSTLIEDMWETMYFSDGIGLAAPQIGRAIRLFVIDADPMAETFPECKGLKQTFINARIVESSEETLAENEGCLSIPGINEKVTRPATITIEYLDADFQPHLEPTPDPVHEYSSYSPCAQLLSGHGGGEPEGKLSPSPADSPPAV